MMVTIMETVKFKMKLHSYRDMSYSTTNKLKYSVKAPNRIYSKDSQ
jgi:hypothetical protein